MVTRTDLEKKAAKLEAALAKTSTPLAREQLQMKLDVVAKQLRSMNEADKKQVGLF